MLSQIQERLRLFVSPDGTSEPLQTISTGKGKQGHRPLLRTLAGAGLGAFIALTGAGEAYGHGIVENGIFGSFLGGQKYESNRSEQITNSPDLGVHAHHLNEHMGLDVDTAENLPDVTVRLLDLRDDSRTFAQYLHPDDYKTMNWEITQPMARFLPTTEENESLSLSRAGEARPYICAVTLGGPSVAGSINDKMASLAHLRATNVAPEDLHVVFTDYEFDKYIFYHELGHCLDKTLEEALMRHYPPGPKLEHFTHQKESRADAFALIMMARELGDVERVTQLGENMADVRMNAMLVGMSHIPTLVRFMGLSNRVLPTSHYTTETLDATMQWIGQTGVDAIRKMSIDEIYGHVRSLADRNAMDYDDFVSFRHQMLDLRRGNGGELVVHPEILDRKPYLLGRATLALSRLNVNPESLDIGSINEGSMPIWLAAADTRGQASAPAVEMDEMEGQSLASRFLAADIEEGADITGVSRSRGGWLVEMVEPDGRKTSARVSNDAVIRYNAEGHVQSLSGNRPAMVRGDAVVHAWDGQLASLGEVESRNVDRTSSVDHPSTFK